MNPHTTPFRCGTEISEDLWIQELRKKGALDSPLFNGVPDREQHARECYRYIVEHAPHSAEVFIGIAGREHSYGTNPDSVLHRNDTRSFTNARSIRMPGVLGTVIYDANRRGYYVKYANALESIKDGIYRVDEPGYAYAGKHTIAEVIKVWAPAEDSNDPEGYAWFVANVVAGLRSRMTPVVPGGDFPLIPFVPADSRHYTKGRTIAWPDLLVQHHTDGWDSLAWLTTSPNSNVSATYLTNHDGTPRAQLVKHEDTPHTTGVLNYRTLTVEWERKWPEQRPIQEHQYRNLGKLWAQIILTERARGNPNFQAVPRRSQMIGHNDVANTTCPGDLNVDVLFEWTLRALAEYDGRPADKPGMRLFRETGRYIYGGFKGLWEELESYGPHVVYRVLGYPKTDEGWAIVNGERRRIQFFDKAVLVWNEHLEHPYDVTFMNRDEWEQIESFEEDRVAA